jgi:thiamine biosynthesis lipoprotein
MRAAPTFGEVVIRRAEPVMGTVVSFDVRPRGLSYGLTREALRQACSLLHRADNVFSLYRSDSPLSQLRTGELSLADCPPEVADVLALCELARDQSGGWFDPWAMPSGFDPTGLVKGWAAARAADSLHDAGVGAAMVNAAGDISVFGRPAPSRPWRVGIRSPDAPNLMLCVVETGGAVATSGNYERGPHVLDVRTGTVAAAALSATVCGPELIFADAFATGLLAAGEAGFAAVREAGYEALIARADGSQANTPAFPFADRTV